MAESTPTSKAWSEDAVWDALRTCYDPEIPVNLVDLGLIYSCKSELRADSSHAVNVQMTLTAPGCALAGSIKANVERALMAVPGVSAVQVELTFDPPWHPSRMSEGARLKLGLF